MSIASTWGTCPEERRLSYPCDRLIPHPEDSLYRGVTINASPEVVFRWLCQMRVAPYSYDFVDNGGKRSPQQLTPGLDQLAIGQDLMSIFDLAAFARNEHLTIRMKPGTKASRIFGDIAGSYLILPQTAESCRLLVKLAVEYPRGFGGRLMSRFLPWGDWFMMRRQLLNFKELAEGMVRSPKRPNR